MAVKIRWGAVREVLITMYKNLTESRNTYGSEIFGPVRRSKMEKLRQLQHSAIRVATAAFRTCPSEAVVLKSHKRRYLLRIKQFFNQAQHIETYSNYE